MTASTKHDGTGGHSRRGFLATTAVLGSFVIPGVAGTAFGDHKNNRNSRDNDPEKVFVDIRKKRLIRGFFESIQRHENDHVAFLVNALGANARPKPTFQNLEQTSLRAFAELARTFENVGVGAYLGAAPAIQARRILRDAASIATVEARHAGFLNTSLGFPITEGDESFEDPLTAAEVGSAVAPFIADLNGGPPVTYDTARSADNDTAILNFALALEYLEAEFYNINVPLYF